MRSIFSVGISACLITILFISCENQAEKEEHLAKKYCSSCHLFPEPSLLDKKTWEKSVLPEMGFRMGMNYSYLEKISEIDMPIVIKTLPGQPMVSVEEWESIKNYFITHAPDSLVQPEIPEEFPLQQFEVTKFRLPVNTFATLTLIEADTIHKNIYIGTRAARLYKFGFDLSLKDSIQLPSPASTMLFTEKENPMIITMGIMDPNDQSLGSLNILDESKRELKSIIDSLKRPVFIKSADFNKDNLEDYVICAFGNYTGALLLYENVGDGNFKEHVLSSLPGSRNVVIKDFDNDGYPDVLALLTQGDEQISVFKNTGNFKFKLTTLLRFPPVYGSSYFDVVDFNKDGINDILYSNGDNFDFSRIFKPYHGIRLYLGDDKNQFKETWFYPMYGASQVVAKDFDIDGDIDIAAFSFFPDFMNHAERSFIYFENTGTELKPFITPLAASGRWMVMETVDLEHDGDQDILLGAMNFANPNGELFAQWWKEKTSVLVLKNNKFNSPR